MKTKSSDFLSIIFITNCNFNTNAIFTITDKYVMHSSGFYCSKASPPGGTGTHSQTSAYTQQPKYKYALVKGAYDAHEIIRISDLYKNLPENRPINRIKCLGQVDKNGK